MIRRPPRSTLFPYTPALPISGTVARGSSGRNHPKEGKRRLGDGKTGDTAPPDRKSTRLNSSHANISYAVFCLKKKNNPELQSAQSLGRRPILAHYRRGEYGI